MHAGLHRRLISPRSARFCRAPSGTAGWDAWLFTNLIFGPNMGRNALAVMLVSCQFPVVACAAPAPAPCSLLDRETLAALHLGDANTKIEHRTVAATAQAPAQRVAMCTFTPRVGASPTLSVMVLPLPANTPAARPVCSDNTVKAVGMTSCFGVARDNMVSMSLVSPVATFAALNATLRARFAHLIDGAAGPVARAGASK